MGKLRAWILSVVILELFGRVERSDPACEHKRLAWLRTFIHSSITFVWVTLEAKRNRLHRYMLTYRSLCPWILDVFHLVSLTHSSGRESNNPMAMWVTSSRWIDILLWLLRSLYSHTNYSPSWILICPKEEIRQVCEGSKGAGTRPERLWEWLSSVTGNCSVKLKYTKNTQWFWC